MAKGKGIKQARENPFFAAERGPSKRVMVNLKDIDVTWPSDWQDIQKLRDWVEWRVVTNVRDTGNPMHHRAATGVVVDRDPTLEKAIARLEREAGVTTVPTIDDYYLQHPEVLEQMGAVRGEEQGGTVH